MRAVGAEVVVLLSLGGLNGAQPVPQAPVRCGLLALPACTLHPARLRTRSRAEGGGWRLVTN
jgi:hypothetical protein